VRKASGVSTPLVPVPHSVSTQLRDIVHSKEPVTREHDRGHCIARGIGPVQRIKVLVANQPRLMRELVLETISDHPEIEVMGEIQDDSKIAEVVEELQPDCVVIGLDQSDSRPSLCDLLLERHPHLKILALAAERNSSIFYWATLSIRSNRVETSERGILNALRGMAPVDTGVFFSGGNKKVH